MGLEIAGASALPVACGMLQDCLQLLVSLYEQVHDQLLEL